MNTPTPRISTSFRLRSDLMARLRESAARSNRSLNNYVESVLLEKEFAIPNLATREAITEARQGKSAGTLDISALDSFMNDLNAID